MTVLIQPPFHSPLARHNAGMTRPSTPKGIRLPTTAVLNLALC
ncbi:hypothetical protein [Deinococcus sp.]|nr:hypothetical protein [Deinococcus sp.]